jgi:hypothetical protein
MVRSRGADPGGRVSTEYVFARASGGHWFHARPVRADGTHAFRAICGFEPLSMSGGPRGRGVWRYVASSALEPQRICPKCRKKLGVA